ISWRRRGRSIATARVQPSRLDGDRRESHRVRPGGERLANGRVVVGEVIDTVRPGRVATGRELGDVVRPGAGGRQPEVRERLRTYPGCPIAGEKTEQNASDDSIHLFIVFETPSKVIPTELPVISLY